MSEVTSSDTTGHVAPDGELAHVVATVAARRTRRRRSPARSVELMVVFAGITVGAIERWWVATHGIGTLTSDGSIIGLMAVHLLHHGQIPAYMWGQAYGGSLETVLTAGVFAAFGTGTSQLLATTALTSALAALALWWAGRRIVGERAAVIGALAFWIWPSLFMWRSLKPGGTYIVGLVLALLAVAAIARIRGGDARSSLLVMTGIWCGLAFWSSPMTLQVLVPAVIWCWRPLVALGRRFAILAAGAVLGAMPAIVFGATHGWTNLAAPAGHGLLPGLPGRFWQFFAIEAPVAMSLRVEGSLAWVEGPVGVVLACVALVGVVLVAVRVVQSRAERCTLPVLTVALLPIVFALNQLADHAGQGRYVLLGSSMGSLLMGVGIENAGTSVAARFRARRSASTASNETPGVLATGVCVVVLAMLAALGIAALRDEPPRLIAEFPVGGVPMPPDDLALRVLISTHEVSDAFAPYWMAYRVTFETNERTLVTPYSFSRYLPIAYAVRASPHPAYLFVSSSPTVGRFRAWCGVHHVKVQFWQLGQFTIAQPTTRLLPSQVPSHVIG